MRQLLILLILLSEPGISFSQKIKMTEQQVRAKEYFDAGTRELKNGHYLMADSLLRLSINNKPNGDNYFNRAVDRFYMHDTCRFCEDLIQAMYFEDRESAHLYAEFCADIDTFYYDKKMNPAGENKFRYFEIREIRHFSGDTVFDVYSRFRQNNALEIKGTGEINFRTNFLASYRISNGEKIFMNLRDKPQFNYNGHSPQEYFLQHCDTTFHPIETVRVKFLVSPEGKISNVKIIPTDLNEKFRIELKQAALNLTVIKPAKFLHQNCVYEYNMWVYLAEKLNLSGRF